MLITTDSGIVRMPNSDVSGGTEKYMFVHQQGGPYWEKLRPRAVLETEGIVFPNTDRPRPVNNIIFYLFLNSKL